MSKTKTPDIVYAILELDLRDLDTPAKMKITLPSREIAETVCNEWNRLYRADDKEYKIARVLKRRNMK